MSKMNSEPLTSGYASIDVWMRFSLRLRKAFSYDSVQFYVTFGLVKSYSGFVNLHSLSRTCCSQRLGLKNFSVQSLSLAFARPYQLQFWPDPV